MDTVLNHVRRVLKKFVFLQNVFISRCIEGFHFVRVDQYRQLIRVTASVYVRDLRLLFSNCKFGGLLVLGRRLDRIPSCF